MTASTLYRSTCTSFCSLPLFGICIQTVDLAYTSIHRHTIIYDSPSRLQAHFLLLSTSDHVRHCQLLYLRPGLVVYQWILIRRSVKHSISSLDLHACLFFVVLGAMVDLGGDNWRRRRDLGDRNWRRRRDLGGECSTVCGGVSGGGGFLLQHLFL